MRTTRQKKWKEQAVKAFRPGVDANIEWLHNQIPDVWRPMPNPYPADAASLSRGKRIFQDYCINCHGPVGDGQGPAAKFLMPPPLNFTTLRRHLEQNKYIGGIFYYQIMNGITGTAMPYFKFDLESTQDLGRFELRRSFVPGLHRRQHRPGRASMPPSSRTGRTPTLRRH